MSEYLEARAEGIRILDRLFEINVEYRKMAQRGMGNVQQELSALIAREEMTLREGVMTLGKINQWLILLANVGVLIGIMYLLEQAVLAARFSSRDSI